MSHPPHTPDWAQMLFGVACFGFCLCMLAAALVYGAARGRDEDEVEGLPCLCNPGLHLWVDEYYGYRCSVCREFIPHGCEPWLEGDEDDGD